MAGAPVPSTEGPRPDRFAVAISCIDGRTHPPLIDWVRARAGVDWVDLVTEPGADAALAGCDRLGCHDVRSRLHVSLAAHRPTMVVVAGHEGCAANPVSAAAHRDQLRRAIALVRSWNLDIPAAGVLVRADGTVVTVTSTSTSTSTGPLAVPAAAGDAR